MKSVKIKSSAVDDEVIGLVPDISSVTIDNLGGINRQKRSDGVKL